MYDFLDDDAANPIAEIYAHYLTQESALVQRLTEIVGLNKPERRDITETAAYFVERIRAEDKHDNLIDAFLQEYDLSTSEGIALMRLSEALIRTPDFSTARTLIRDKLNQGDWQKHTGASPSPLVNLATTGLRLSSFWIKISGGAESKNIIAKLGDRVFHQAVSRAMTIMAENFVLGRSIEDAVLKARKNEQNGFTHSYDMLGEAAVTADDAEQYFNAYMQAIKHLATTVGERRAIADAPGMSVKLSALHPRYEIKQHHACVPQLVSRVQQLALVAKSAGLGLTIDAEEADRLELSLMVFEQLLQDPALESWGGLGFVIQAYQRRALPVCSCLIAAAKQANRKITVRLVKGAYWDTEIKRAQELGLESYPVFTRKENTDASYLACARILLNAGDTIFAQFATHNAHTIAAVACLAGDNRHYEFQRLHGMGEALHVKAVHKFGVSSRIYAPVGEHKDLLPYLVRRLLENGANSSFVNQLLDPAIDIEKVVSDPITIVDANSEAANPSLPIPRDLFDGARLSATGLDLSQSTVARETEAIFPVEGEFSAKSIVNGVEQPSDTVQIANPADCNRLAGIAHTATDNDIQTAIAAAKNSGWISASTCEERAACLLAAATLLENETQKFINICVVEAGKTLPDAVAEIREAIDFCRYYANQATSPRMATRSPLGVVATISPWNFPLAIFMGQVVAALAAGNAVVAKPAEQTPLIAYEAVRLLHRAGVPQDALHLLIGDGVTVGAPLASHPNVSGICFTGSTATAKRIGRGLADAGRAATPFIAETGGINAMIVDSTALLEQAVKDVVDSAFHSAGQRCSACRIVCVQSDIADDFIKMLSGAMAALKMGNPARLATDIGPIIDEAAHKPISTYLTNMHKRFTMIAQTPLPTAPLPGHFIQPVAFEVHNVSDVTREIFGPVLHLVRFGAADLDNIVDDINGLGYGLTMGLHTRIDARVSQVAARTKVGNLYVNRNQVGAVVGVQPFGGEGFSGTGPKAGGPNYLPRLSIPVDHCANDEVAPPPAWLEKQNNRESDAAIIVAKSRWAQQIWASADHALKLRNVIGIISNHPKFSACDPIEIRPTPKPSSLQGPTGEENTLTLYPRGVVACFGGDHPLDLIRQIFRALSAGNSVIVIDGSDTDDMLTIILSAMNEAALPQDLVCLAPATSNLLNANIDGAVADGALRTPVAAQLCTRDGPILPLLSKTDGPDCFSHERTLTINTTAAGGNASLFTL